MEDKVSIEIGDVILVASGGYGLEVGNEGLYVEVLEFSHKGYYGGAWYRVGPYDNPLINHNQHEDWVTVETFGVTPLILFNTKEEVKEAELVEEYTGSSSNYYKVYVKHPTTLDEPYEAECNDVIEALKMTFAEGNAFKAIWRKAKARQGVKKKGYDNGLYDSEKVVFFGERMVVEATENQDGAD